MHAALVSVYGGPDTEGMKIDSTFSSNNAASRCTLRLASHTHTQPLQLSPVELSRRSLPATGPGSSNREKLCHNEASDPDWLPIDPTAAGPALISTILENSQRLENFTEYHGLRGRAAALRGVQGRERRRRKKTKLERTREKERERGREKDMRKKDDE
ncbi:hypothetical protein EYF80_032957 [Liparis tanakae]|uniref:Uncharacterized protein n=1 Tax=Liparis tanakae TaxID=230148 RepID=A0A4Z2GU42_9TELE|nr:hypothetical protein EYF80_032957 [Liparis tanakae]